MTLSDFEIGRVYHLRIAAWEAPDGQVVPEKELIRRVLEPADKRNSTFEDGPAPDHVIEEWSRFLRVEEVSSGKIHLIDPGTIASATPA